MRELFFTLSALPGCMCLLGLYLTWVASKHDHYTPDFLELLHSGTAWAGGIAVFFGVMAALLSRSQPRAGHKKPRTGNAKSAARAGKPHVKKSKHRSTHSHKPYHYHDDDTVLHSASHDETRHLEVESGTCYSAPSDPGGYSGGFSGGCSGGDGGD